MLNIKVVGKGCPNCEKLAALCKEAAEEQNLEYQIEKITDINEFPKLGVYMTPGLIVNDKLLSIGKIPTKHTLAHWLKEHDASHH